MQREKVEQRGESGEWGERGECGESSCHCTATLHCMASKLDLGEKTTKQLKEIRKRVHIYKYIYDIWNIPYKIKLPTSKFIACVCVWCASVCVCVL